MLQSLCRNLRDSRCFLEDLESRTLLSADLALSVGTLKQSFDHSNNPTISLQVKVSNLGSTGLVGGGSIDYYLSSDQTLDENDFRFASTSLPNVRARSVGTVTLNTIKPAFVAPRVGRAIPVGDYFVIATLVTKKTGADSNPDNNQAVTVATLSINYLFGQVGVKSNVPLAVMMPDGSTLTFSLRGAGTGQVVNVDNQVFVVVSGSTTQSSLNIGPANRKQFSTIAGLTINGSLKNLIADHLTIDGNLTIQGAVGQVVLGNLYHSTFAIDGFGASVAVTIGQVADSSLTTQIPLRQLSVARWRDSDLTKDLVTAPYIGDLNSSADFEAGVSLSTVHKGVSIANVKIGGHITGNWIINGGISLLQVGSIGANFTGTIRGDIDNVNVKGNAGGTMGVANVKRMIVGGNLTGATYLAGADLGSNGQLDGSDSGDDTFSFGRFGLIDIRGQMINSFVGAGVSTQDSLLGNSDDQLESNSFIETISVRKGLSHSAFAAAHLPTKATISNKSIATAGNPSFITVQST